jgi:hypothetical protein
MLTGLATLTTATNNLLRSYIDDINRILSDAGVPHHVLQPNMLLGVSMDSLFNGANQGLTAGMQSGMNVPSEMSKGKKGSLLTLVPMNKVKKERKQRDPNAPKRPLTAYFLYSQSARPIIKNELGEGASNTEVSKTVLERWQDMPPVDKEVRCSTFYYQLSLMSS